MIVVNIDLWPHGDEVSGRTLRQLVIINTGAGSKKRGIYRAYVSKPDMFFENPHKPESDSNLDRGILGVTFNRAKGVMKLLRKVLSYL